jgi:GNAT superfamily N-acetyltransferase
LAGNTRDRTALRFNPSPYAVSDPTDDAACFSAVRRDDGELIGEALLWGIDPHNRAAHLGVAVLPASRGRGLGSDILRRMAPGPADPGVARQQPAFTPLRPVVPDSYVSLSYQKDTGHRHDQRV